MDRGAWRATGHRVAKSQTQLIDYTAAAAFINLHQGNLSAITFISARHQRCYKGEYWGERVKGWKATQPFVLIWSLLQVTDSFFLLK